MSQYVMYSFANNKCKILVKGFFQRLARLCGLERHGSMFLHKVCSQKLCQKVLSQLVVWSLDSPKQVTYAAASENSI